MHARNRQVLPANQLMSLLYDRKEISKMNSRDREILSVGFSAGVELMSPSDEMDELHINFQKAEAYRPPITDSSRIETSNFQEFN